MIAALIEIGCVRNRENAKVLKQYTKQWLQQIELSFFFCEFEFVYNCDFSTSYFPYS